MGHIKTLVFCWLFSCTNLCAQTVLPNCLGGMRWDNCLGSLLYPGGEKYIGAFLNDKFNGQGTYTYADGRKYVGEFKNFKYHGMGTLYASSGAIIQEGVWEDDQLVHSQKVQNNIQLNLENASPNEGSTSQKLRELKNEIPIKPTSIVGDRLSFEASKKKCTELGFKPATEGHGKCVLQLSK